MLISMNNFNGETHSLITDFKYPFFCYARNSQSEKININLAEVFQLLMDCEVTGYSEITEVNVAD